MKQGYLEIDNNIFSTLLALSEEEQANGLMYQSWPPPVMSFVYDSPKVSYFWMKNTPSPIDIVFCYNGKINKICKGEPHSTSLIGHNSPSDLVVEFPFGTMKNLNIKEGCNIELFKPNKKEISKFLKFNYYK